MSVLLKRWKCIDEDVDIKSEVEYRVHASVHPDHKVVSYDE